MAREKFKKMRVAKRDMMRLERKRDNEPSEKTKFIK